jgi:D-inositol-3-phosphate glycosyltransferase
MSQGEATNDGSQSDAGALVRECLTEPRIAILTAGKDPHYAISLLGALVQQKLSIEFIGNDEMTALASPAAPNVELFNLRGNQSERAPLLRRATRVLSYYAKLVCYAARTEARLLHILWFNKFEWFDNTVLILYYRALGKRVVYTAHNVNTRERDGKGGVVTRWSLRFLYRNVDHILVHTAVMKARLATEYSVPTGHITVIPFGLNMVTPNSGVTSAQAKARLRLQSGEKILLFFGNIAPYKGLDTLLQALQSLHECRLIIAGRIKECMEYWGMLERRIDEYGLSDRVLKRLEYIPEDEVEFYFKAADVLIAPYRRIDQSGVVFLSHGFGLPVIVSDAGSLAEAVQEGITGYVFRTGDAADLASRVRDYFASELFARLDQSRLEIVRLLNARHSWPDISDEICRVYARVGGWASPPHAWPRSNEPSPSADCSKSERIAR